MRIPKIDKEKCIGCGTCPLICPNVFRMTDENKAEVTNDTGDTEENIQSAVDACPTAAIFWEEKV